MTDHTSLVDGVVSWWSKRAINTAFLMQQVHLRQATIRKRGRGPEQPKKPPQKAHQTRAPTKEICPSPSRTEINVFKYLLLVRTSLRVPLPKKTGGRTPVPSANWAPAVVVFNGLSPATTNPNAVAPSVLRSHSSSPRPFFDHQRAKSKMSHGQDGAKPGRPYSLFSGGD